MNEKNDQILNFIFFQIGNKKKRNIPKDMRISDAFRSHVFNVVASDIGIKE